MRDLRTEAKNPAYALAAMAHGLRNPRGLRIDMGTYARVDANFPASEIADKGLRTCYGCAATCALQEITDTSITSYIDDAEDVMKASDDLSCARWAVYNLSKREYENPSKREYEHFERIERALDEFEAALEKARLGSLTPLFHFFSCQKKWSASYDRLPSLDEVNYIETLTKYDAVIDSMHDNNPEWERF